MKKYEVKITYTACAVIDVLADDVSEVFDNVGLLRLPTDAVVQSKECRCIEEDVNLDLTKMIATQLVKDLDDKDVCIEIKDWKFIDYLDTWTKERETSMVENITYDKDVEEILLGLENGHEMYLSELTPVLQYDICKDIIETNKNK